MKFANSADAFNFYMGMPDSIIEARAQAIKADVANDPNCDVASYKAELDGIKAVKEGRSTEKRSNQVRIVENTSDDVFATNEYRSAFYHTVMGQKLTDAERALMTSDAVLKRSAEFNSSDNSAAVLPTQTLNEVVKRAKDRGGIVSVARAFAMPTGISIPVAGPGSKAVWHEEGAAVDTEKFVTTPVKFDGYELLRIFSISKKVDTMSIPAFESAIVEELSDSIMEAIAEGLVTGSGEGEGTGIESITWTEGTNLTTVAENVFDWKSIVSFLGSLRRGYATNAKLAMNNATLFNRIYASQSDDGEPVYLTTLQGNGSTMFLGKEIVVDDYLDDDVIIFGDFSKLGYNLPSGVAIERSTESGFRTGTIDFRGMAIADSKVILPEAFTKLVIDTE